MLGIANIGVFYIHWELRPELRSTQRSVQLIACVSSPVLVKHGFEAILKAFIEDVNILSRVGIAVCYPELQKM